MSTYRMVQRPKSSIVTMEFNNYTEAAEFQRKSAALLPSKPFKGFGVNWYVSLPGTPEPAKYEKVEDWYKPFPSYDEWKGVEGLYKIPVYLPQPRTKRREFA